MLCMDKQVKLQSCRSQRPVHSNAQLGVMSCKILTLKLSLYRSLGSPENDLVTICLEGLTCWRLQWFTGQVCRRCRHQTEETWRCFCCKLALLCAVATCTLTMSAEGAHLLQDAGADSNKQQQAGGIGIHAQLHVAVSIKELGACGQNGQPCRQQRSCPVTLRTPL